MTNTNTQERILKALEDAYANACDNAARARLAFGKQNMNSQHGESGRTRGDILAGYEQEEQEALAALKDVAPDWAPRKMFSKP
jgi:hypothetical protein